MFRDRLPRPAHTVIPGDVVEDQDRSWREGGKDLLEVLDRGALVVMSIHEGIVDGPVVAQHAVERVLETADDYRHVGQSEAGEILVAREAIVSAPSSATSRPTPFSVRAAAS